MSGLMVLPAMLGIVPETHRIGAPHHERLHATELKRQSRIHDRTNMRTYWVVLDAARIRRSDGGRSKRGSMPRMGAIREITLPAVGTAFQPEVMNPYVSFNGCGS